MGKPAGIIMVNERYQLAGENNDYVNSMIDEKVETRNTNFDSFVFDNSLVKRTDSMVVEIVPINVDE